MFKIVADSSSNMFELEGVPFSSVPLKIITSKKEYIDSPELDLPGMVEDLKGYKGKSGTSCPNFQDWTDSFENADCVFAATITSKMSGSYSSAAHAAAEYMEEHPDKKIFVLDSRSAGPGIRLQVEKIRDSIKAGLDFESIQEKILDYQSHVHLLFSLESLHNLGQNGRCSPAVARIAGVLGIRLVGDEKDGDLHPLHKCRGEKKALDALFHEMVEQGFANGCKACISHCFNENAAIILKRRLEERFPHAKIRIEKTTALCSFYAESGGLMIGFEDSGVVI